MASIDGGVLVDENGVCFANGVILDGIVGYRGNSARGSRYNSAITYQEFFEFKKPTMVIVISEDGMVDVIPTLLQRISHAEILAVIAVLEEIKRSGHSNSGTFDDAMQWLQNRQFYLTLDECERINKLNDTISEANDGQHMRIIYPHFAPNPDMNDSYYLDEDNTNDNS